MHSQLEYLRDCLPVHICQALDELPDTLDGTYERMLRETKSTNWEFERRPFLCAAMASRPHSVEELTELLAFDFKAEPYSEISRGLAPGRSNGCVLSTCSTLLANVCNS